MFRVLTLATLLVAGFAHAAPPAVPPAPIKATTGTPFTFEVTKDNGKELGYFNGNPDEITLVRLFTEDPNTVSMMGWVKTGGRKYAIGFWTKDEIKAASVVIDASGDSPVPDNATTKSQFQKDVEAAYAKLSADEKKLIPGLTAVYAAGQIYGQSSNLYIDVFKNMDKWIVDMQLAGKIPPAFQQVVQAELMRSVPWKGEATLAIAPGDRQKVLDAFAKVTKVLSTLK